MNVPKPVKRTWKFLLETVTKFAADNAFTWAAAISYYTIFSLPPILLVILYITTMFYDEQSIREAIFGQIGSLIGNKGANQLSQTVDSLGVFKEQWWASAIGIGGMLLTSTTVFMTLQNALNSIFKVKAQPNEAGWFKMIRDRLLSFTVLLGIAFILLVSLVIDAIISGFGDLLSQRFPDVSLLLVGLASIIVPLAIITLLFALLFKYLPDAAIPWRLTWRGAIITAVLFALGKNAIGFYIGQSQTASLYDAAGSILVIMLWVFYASLIFLFGAVITAVYVERSSYRGIEPADYAVKVEDKEVEVEKGNDTEDKPVEEDTSTSL
ncbi:YihY/virulence factor BrkB family protein [Flavilitoribacter nigricans]|uniref:Ribonuclease BN n=1 Tax=Flavilitoribacter nigricans (strain ATCC 23147 / DSM 23189 / NBRC 102662 / NCIMB 1420 / SS-2) TaxID=1122177 RepID=A0A2D0N953_FLAN2|nr:YihY/virulence factor BrkB family protein [Flavilitoribacter nigricans]PHN05052.1 ribonuclease BN [Flavilitoribacter nigricans DSM 23189 = NBRC 102662]